MLLLAITKPLISLHNFAFHALSRLTASVSRLGWDETTPLFRNQLEAKKKLKKRGAYPKSAARNVRSQCGGDYALYKPNERE